MAEYIDREKAKSTLVQDYAYAAATLLDEVPKADAAPVVHGLWISWEQAGNFIPSTDRHECSVCHDAAQVLVNGIELLSPYCPNCGARMDEEVSDGKSEIVRYAPQGDCQ